MISDKFRGLEFEEISEIDTRSFRITRLDCIPGRLYILNSEPLNYTELLQFLTIIEGRPRYATNWTPEIASGFWPLKYIYVIWNKKSGYYILSRYLKTIWWKKILTA